MPAFELDSTPDTVNLRLCSEVTIEHAGALHQALQAALTADRTLVIDRPARPAGPAHRPFRRLDRRAGPARGPRPVLKILNRPPPCQRP